MHESRSCQRHQQIKTKYLDLVFRLAMTVIRRLESGALFTFPASVGALSPCRPTTGKMEVCLRNKSRVPRKGSQRRRHSTPARSFRRPSPTTSGRLRDELATSSTVRPTVEVCGLFCCVAEQQLCQLRPELAASQPRRKRQRALICSSRRLTRSASIAIISREDRDAHTLTSFAGRPKSERAQSTC